MINQLLATASQALQAGDFAKAEHLLQKAVATDPKNLDARIGLGFVAAGARRIDQAVERMREVLAIDPKCLPALQWLTLNAAGGGNPADGVAYAARYLELQPRDAQIHYALGSCQLQLEQAPAALAEFDIAIALQPGVAAFHYYRAAALLRLELGVEAVDALKRAVELSPTVEPILRLADAEAHVGRTEDALATCKRALALSQNDASIHLALAKLYANAGRMEEAERYWSRAAELEPTARRVVMSRTEASIFSGEFGAALEHSRTAIAADPNNGAAYRTIAYLQRTEESDRSMVEKMEQLAANEGLDANDRADLFYGLGKAYSDLGEFGASMNAYDEANALMLPSVLKGRTFVHKGFRAYIDQLIKLYDPELFTASRSTENTSSLPIVVIGLLRSGTTLAEQILSCHPEVGAAGEQTFWSNHEHEVIEGEPPSVNLVRVRELSGMYVARLRQVAPGFTRVVDKNPANSLTAGLIHLALPQAKIVRMRRSLLDTALSIWTTPMRTMAPFVYDRENIVFALKEVSRLLNHWREVFPPSQYLELDYESLVDEPERAMRALVAFCGLEWNAACLHPEENKRPVNTPSFWQVRRPIYKTSKERWRDYEPWLGAFEKLRKGSWA